MGAGGGRKRSGGNGWTAFWLGPFAFRVYPELRLARTAFERTEASARAKMSRKPTLAAAAPVSVIALGVGVFVATFRYWRPYWMPEWFAVVGVLGCAALAAIVGTVAVREPGRRAIREFLLGRGIPVCLHCGYDLRGLSAAGGPTDCPECGHGIPPQAMKILQDPRTG